MDNIYSYHNFEDWVAKGTSDLKFGFELEVNYPDGDDYCDEDNEFLDSIAGKVCEIMEHNVICSSDSSIEFGFEIVSHPMSYDYLQRMMPNIEKMCKLLIDNGFTSHIGNCCGLHIHVSRKGLKSDTNTEEDTINNMLMLFENFKPELLVFSRRTNSQLSEWCTFLSDSTITDDIIGMTFVKDQKKRISRYSAINLQPSKTVELRLFRGTLNINTLKATFAFVNRLITMAKLPSIEGCTWKKLITTVEGREYCTKRNIVSKTKAHETVIRFNETNSRNIDDLDEI